MPVFTLFDVVLLGFLGALLALGLAFAALLVRRITRDMEDATAAIEILRDHPDLLQLSPNWTRWTGKVDMPAPRPRFQGLLN